MHLRGMARVPCSLRHGTRRAYCTPPAGPLPKFRQTQQRLLQTSECEYLVSQGRVTGQQPVPDSEEGLGSFAKVFPSAALLMPARALKLLDTITTHLLPKGCLDGSVSPAYFKYVSWYIAGAVIGTGTSVFSMQSLLYAAGLGAGALPVAAALSWVLKDGLGQLGGVLFASVVNRNFDADPKRWRFVAALLLDVAAVIEGITPFCPMLFLPLAALANGLKNVSFLSASATRASFHQAFAQKGNLADITAKAGAQTTFAATVGMGMAVTLSAVVGDNHLHILYCILGTASVHLMCQAKSISVIAIPSINLQRAELLVKHFLEGRGVRTPDEISQEEVFIGKQGAHLLKGYVPSVNIGPTLPEFIEATGYPLERIARDLKGRGYCMGSGQLLLAAGIDSDTLLRAVFVAVGGLQELGDADARFEEFREGLIAAGWSTQNLAVEERDSRIHLDWSASSA